MPGWPGWAGPVRAGCREVGRVWRDHVPGVRTGGSLGHASLLLAQSPPRVPSPVPRTGAGWGAMAKGTGQAVAERTRPQVPHSCPSRTSTDGGRAPTTSLPGLYSGNWASVSPSPWCRSRLMANGAGEH